MRKRLCQLRALLPLTLLLCALAILIAGRSNLHLYLGHARHYLVAVTDRHAAGLRFSSNPDRDATPLDPWLQIYHHQDRFVMIDVDGPYPSEFDSPFWATDRGLNFDHAGIRAAAGKAQSMSPATSTAFLILPHYFTLTTTSLLLLTQFLLHLRRYHRGFTKPGHCTTCGYDRRHSPTRCPECGTPAPPRTHPPLFIRLTSLVDQSLRHHPHTAALSLFLLTLLLANTGRPTTYLPAKPSPALLPIPTSIHPVTLLYPIDSLLTAPNSPLTETPQERVTQLEERLTTLDPPSWRINGGDLCSSWSFRNTLLITAPATFHPQIQSLLTHIPQQSPPTPTN